MFYSFWLDGKEFKMNIRDMSRGALQVDMKDRSYDLQMEQLSDHEFLLNIGGRIYDAIITADTLSYSVYLNGNSYRLDKKSAARILGVSSARQIHRDVKTSMPGKIVRVLVEEGAEVEEGQAVMILEAMKMQNEIKSPKTGILCRIYPVTGDSVEAGAILFSVD